MYHPEFAQWLKDTAAQPAEALQGMPLETFWCKETSVAELSPLYECKSLKELNVEKTKVSPAVVAALQKALPNCKVTWDDPAKATPNVGTK